MRNKPHPYVSERSSAWTRSDSRPNYQQLELFPETVYTCTDGYASISSPPALRDAREEKNGAENICLARRLTFSSTYEMPKVAAYQDSIPEYLIPFYRLGCLSWHSGVCPCFYTKDSNFLRAWTRPTATAHALQAYSYTLSTDFSVHIDMPRPAQVASIYRNKFLAAYWQSQGLRVIPSISWTTISHIEEDLDGWPSHSIIAINSTGLGRDRRARHNWQEGYEATVAILKPTCILRYGARQEGEDSGISHYFPNANRLYKLLHNDGG